jgi:hypothetical protein
MPGIRPAAFLPSARQLVRQDGGVTAPRAGRGRPGWPMAAHQLASAYRACTRKAANACGEVIVCAGPSCTGFFLFSTTRLSSTRHLETLAE